MACRALRLFDTPNATLTLPLPNDVHALPVSNGAAFGSTGVKRVLDLEGCRAQVPRGPPRYAVPLGHDRERPKVSQHLSQVPPKIVVHDLYSRSRVLRLTHTVTVAATRTLARARRRMCAARRLGATLPQSGMASRQREPPSVLRGHSTPYFLWAEDGESLHALGLPSLVRPTADRLTPHIMLGTRTGGLAMEPFSPVIEVHGEQITIEAGYLAAKLGLSVDLLRAEMRRGIVYGVVERGIGEDAGRLRLTFRYRARTWTAVVEPDGTLHEAARPRR